jgi:rubrerythrin
MSEGKVRDRFTEILGIEKGAKERYERMLLGIDDAKVRTVIEKIRKDEAKHMLLAQEAIRLVS